MPKIEADLKLADASGHHLVVHPGTGLSADRTLTITMSDADQTLALPISGGGGGSGTVTSVAATAPGAGLIITGSPITTSGTLTFALADDLAALEGLSGTGFAKRTGTSTWTLDTSAYLTAAAADALFLTPAEGNAAYQPLDGDLSAIAALGGTNTIYYRSAASAWSAVTVGTGLTFAAGTLSVTGGTDFLGALVKITSDQAVGTSLAPVSWHAAEYDTSSFWSAGNPTRLTVPAGVTRVRLTGNVEMGTATTGSRALRVTKNGAAAAVMGGGAFNWDGGTGFTSAIGNVGSATLAVSPGDYFELQVASSTASQSAIAAASRTWFAIEAVAVPAADLAVTDTATLDLTLSAGSLSGTVLGAPASGLTGTRVNAYQASSLGQGSGWKTIQLDTETADALNEYNPATWTFTPATTGTYLVSLSATITGNAGLRAMASVWLTTTEDETAGEVARLSDGIDTLAGGTALVTLTGGTAYRFRYYTGSAAANVLGGARYTSLAVRRLY